MPSRTKRSIAPEAEAKPLGGEDRYAKIGAEVGAAARRDERASASSWSTCAAEKRESRSATRVPRAQWTSVPVSSGAKTSCKREAAEEIARW